MKGAGSFKRMIVTLAVISYAIAGIIIFTITVGISWLINEGIELIIEHFN